MNQSIATLAWFRYARFSLSSVLINTLVLLVSDIFLYLSVKSLAGHSSSDFAMYILFAFNLWMFCTPGGLVRELSDLFESGRWVAIDLLPASSTTLAWSYHLFSVLRSQAFWLVGSAWTIAAILFRDAKIAQIALAWTCILLGISVMSLIQISCRLIAPRGQSALVGRIVYFTCWFFSGAVVPIQFFVSSSQLSYLNPMALAVSVPMGSLFCGFEALGLGNVVAGIVWNAALFSFCRWYENRRREKFYV